MVKCYGPCMSLGASGTLADTVTFATWKGRPYARQRVVPSNPKSALQVAMRAMMKFLSQAWTDVGSTPQGSWDELAAAGQYSAFNAFVSKNMMLWREFTAPSQTYPNPGTGVEPVLTLDSATGGDGHADLTITVSTLNDVWGLAIFRSPTGTFTPSLSNCIAVIPVDATGTLVYTDSGLAAGDYWWDAKSLSTEGVLGADEGEVTCTVT